MPGVRPEQPDPRTGECTRAGGSGMSRAGRLRMAAPALAVPAAAGPAAWYLWSRDPHLPGQWLPFCPWRRLTGLDCPGCGGTRLAYDLLHGDLAAAWQDNALLLLALPVFAVWYAVWLRHGLAGRRWRLRLGPRATAVVLGGVVLWTVGRNVW